MNVSRNARNQAQAMKGRITEELGRVTGNRRLQRRGRADRVSGGLKQAVEKAKGAFRRDGGDSRSVFRRKGGDPR
ncbi:CsbD family protein [Streptomyces sp. NPDC008196]|uniref:CsbD family protein n=1 Tax=unclassified Streptomyces TaxID=2593676 RepID=UPI001BAF4ACB|nr:CsbD family protein [Streptomyces sp. A2-16]QUC62919.1 CsbD family protein [Streptomyces sp. A2-16]